MVNRILNQTYDMLLKLVIIGDSSVGKTNLLSRFTSNQFTLQSKPTIGVQFASKTVQIEGQRVKVQIWDTAGQERFRSITHAYYKGASGALIVFDLTRQGTYEHVPKWIKQLKDNTQQNLNTVLIGNKCDLVENRATKQEQAAQFAHQNKMFYLQTSALTADNVQTAFLALIKEIVRKQIERKKAMQAKPMDKSKLNTPVERVQLHTPTSQQRQEKRKCC